LRTVIITIPRLLNLFFQVQWAQVGRISLIKRLKKPESIKSFGSGPAHFPHTVK